MKKRILKSLQVFYGLALVVFGLNGFFHFLPIPEKQGFALEFMTTLHTAGYIFPVVAGIMCVSGILLLMNSAVAFALILMLPISFNIFLFHLLHDQAALVVAYALFALNMFHIFRNAKQYRTIFKKEVA